MATLQDVADEANVTKMTVSNALNGRRDRLSDATYERVMAAVRKLGYVRSATARSLSAKRSHIISLGYVPSTHGRAETSLGHHDSVFLGELEKRVTESGRYLMVHAVTDVTSTAASLKSWNVDGAIFLSTLGDEAEVLRRAHDVPMVFVDNYADSPLISNVRVDDYRGGYLAGRHLTGAGHRRIAFVGPALSPPGVVHERHRGFAAALADAGVRLDPAHVFFCETAIEPARELAARTVAAGPPPFTAVFATADIIAAGLLKGFQRAGLHVPRDMSVIGFDDVEIAELVTPELTTIGQDVPQKAHAAADMLHRQLTGGPDTVPEHISLGVTLVERHSVTASRDR
ncbi:LacI family DNA-binding transcriptional regulator [Streptomyces sp. NPDC059786]|uniref:LacI family DNA-binding transcriptional regulator n=1 Tax=Streptomyces sp. NPDC059786 TaxID=3346946 RepID=UPI00364ABC8B